MALTHTHTCKPQNRFPNSLFIFFYLKLNFHNSFPGTVQVFSIFLPGKILFQSVFTCDRNHSGVFVCSLAQDKRDDRLKLLMLKVCVAVDIDYKGKTKTNIRQYNLFVKSRLLVTLWCEVPFITWSHFNNDLVKMKDKWAEEGQWVLLPSCLKPWQSKINFISWTSYMWDLRHLTNVQM